MAIVEGKSNLIPDKFEAGRVTADPVEIAGRVIVATGNVTNLSTDSNGSSYHLVSLPSDCILLANTFFDVQNDGFAQIVIGTKTDTDALLDVARSAAAIQRPIVDGDANHGKRLWEMLGFAANPGGKIELWKHAEANATGAGTTLFQIHYLAD